MFFREKSRVLASLKQADEVLDAQYLDRKGARKRFTMKISNKKSAHRSKGVGFIKNPHVLAACPQNDISGMCRHEPSFKNLNQCANARKTR